jgi:hypothetical protein
LHAAGIEPASVTYFAARSPFHRAPPFAVRLSVLLLLTVLLLGAAAYEPPVTASSGAAPTDTLRLSIPSGEPLVAALPGDPAWTFRTLRAPALSWLVGRSFYWRTLPGERGREYVLIERRYRGEPQDTLVVVVDVGTE